MYKLLIAITRVIFIIIIVAYFKIAAFVFQNSSSFFKWNFFMPAVHSHRGNPRQCESKNVDGNTHLALDAFL